MQSFAESEIIMNVSNSMPIVVQKVFWVLEIPLDPLIGLFTQCIADMLCLETLKHGTSLKNYLNIRVHGADPKFGGMKGGSSCLSNVEALNSTRGYFFAFKDSGVINLEFLPIRMQLMGDKKALNAFKRSVSIDASWATPYVSIPLGTRMHALMSGACSGGSTMACVSHIVLSFFTPTVNLRFIPEKLNLSRYENVKEICDNDLALQQNRFQEDQDYGGMAWKTKKAIGVNHIGLRGILKQGVKGDILQRIKNNPRKCLFGAVRMVALCLILGALFTNYEAAPL